MTCTRWLAVAVPLAATLVLASCTQPSAGTPVPGDTATRGNSDAAGTEPSSERPREIDLNGKDPCAQISQSDWSKFGIEQPGQRSVEPNLRSPRCYYPQVGDLTLVVTEGIKAWSDRSHDAEITDVKPIEGFTTISIWNTVDRRSCYTAVDVADGQYLLTTVLSVNADVDKAESCGRSYQLAESAMKTLVAS